MFLGVDIGKTKLALGIVSEAGTVELFIDQPTNNRNGGEEIMTQTISAIQGVIAKGYSFSEIGVGSFGMVDPAHGMVIGGKILPGFRNVPVAKLLSSIFKVNVHVENDIYAAVLAERSYGAGRGADSMALVSMGTAVGLGLAFHGELIRGYHELAGQIAHVPMFGEPDVTLSDVLGGAGIAKRCSIALNSPVSTAEVFHLARSGNPAASQVIQDVINGGSLLVAWLQSTFYPEVIVLTGGVIDNQQFMMEMIREKATFLLKAYSTRLPNGPRIVASPLKRHLGVIGAASLCMTPDH